MGRSRGILWALVAVALGCDVEVDQRSAPIIDGEAAPEASAVVLLVERSASCSPAPPQLRCSAALIGPRAVLTAAHCLGEGAPTDLAVRFAPSLDGEGPTIAVTRGQLHPSFDPETRAFDLALLVLESDAPVEPLTLSEAGGAVGDRVTMFGFGGVSADDPVGGERRSGSARIEAVEPNELRLSADPAMSCRGDSGGPVVDAEGAILAVTSSGDPACVAFADVARVDVARSFIDEGLTDSLRTPPERRPFDPAEHFCAETCSADADCPVGTHCFGPEGAPRRCVLPGLSDGELLGACVDDRACGEAPCVATPAGCQCFQSCGFHTHGDAGVGTGGDGGGCAAGGAPKGAVGLPMIALMLIRRRSQAR